MPSFDPSSNSSAGCRPERQPQASSRLEQQPQASSRFDRQRQAGARFEHETLSNRPKPPPTADCRLQWRPSRLLSAALIALGLAAAFSAVASELPLPASLPLAAMALAWAGWSTRREARLPPQPLVIAGGRATLAAAPISDLRLHWRGWLARLDFTGSDGRRRRLLWWPDTLDAAGRRELRLAVAVTSPARGPRSMAP
ncbi:hypothetical protein [Lysobacter sp. TAB13]|uniref:hypothetical protein n=1 Tax=Lysobacter sp. TAB13 TaxID=3233065 RepID=UPI003F9551F9